MSTAQKKKPRRLDPCPAEERVGETGVPDAYPGRTRNAVESQTESEGVRRIKCGGGYLIRKKRIGGD
jgi:hypothetical protein